MRAGMLLPRPCARERSQGLESIRGECLQPEGLWAWNPMNPLEPHDEERTDGRRETGGRDG